ncbi:aminotransferase class IV [Botrimarina sp.]|uniref:aminotransferase class IV n=1 Tax=Botrimarina sp. TaxID=2795802 RepID=UPI0032EED940
MGAAAGVAVCPTANVDGVLSPLDEARVPVTDRGFLYGDSVYEVFRTYDGVPLFWREHFERMENSARLIHMRISQSRDELMDEIRRTAAEAGAGPSADGSGEVYVRWHVSRGTGPIDLFPDPGLRTSYMILVKPVPKWKAEHYTTGLRLAVTGVRRNSPESLDPNIKSGNYLNNILGLAEAAELGADDCLMLSAQGHATEASNSNVFFVTGGRVHTPADSVGNLRGITGSALRAIGARDGWPVEERLIGLDELAQVDEAFVTSATREVMPVAAIRLPSGQWKQLPDGGGPMTRKIAQAYKSHVERYVADNADARLW